MKINNNILIYGSLLILFVIIFVNIDKCCQKNVGEHFDVIKVRGSSISSLTPNLIDGIIDIGKFNFTQFLENLTTYFL